MAHAMLRWLATPRTRPVLPERSILRMARILFREMGPAQGPARGVPGRGLDVSRLPGARPRPACHPELFTIHLPRRLSARSIEAHGVPAPARGPPVGHIAKARGHRP